MAMEICWSGSKCCFRVPAVDRGSAWYSTCVRNHGTTRHQPCTPLHDTHACSVRSKQRALTPASCMKHPVKIEKAYLYLTNTSVNQERPLLGPAELFFMATCTAMHAHTVDMTCQSRICCVRVDAKLLDLLQPACNVAMLQHCTAYVQRLLAVYASCRKALRTSP